MRAGFLKKDDERIEADLFFLVESVPPSFKRIP